MKLFALGVAATVVAAVVVLGLVFGVNRIGRTTRAQKDCRAQQAILARGSSDGMIKPILDPGGQHYRNCVRFFKD